MTFPRIERAAGLLAALVGCGGPELETSRVAFALGDVPARVDSLVFSAFTPDAELVTSATVAAPTRAVALGLPAEIPLELRVTAYTSTPTRFGVRLPAFATRRMRTIPLQRATVVVELVLEPAGLLVLASASEGLRLEGEREEFPSAPAQAGRIEVLPAGLYAFRPESETTRERVAGGEGIWVSPEAIVEARPRREAVPATRPLRLRFLDSGGAPLDAGSGAVAEPPAGLRLESLDEDGDPVSDPNAEFSLEILELAGPSQGTDRFRGLPFETRLELPPDPRGVDVRARRIEGRTPTTRVRLEIAPSPGSVAALEAELLDPDLLDVGESRLRVAIVDARGLLARGPEASIDIDMSDPWVRPVDPSVRRVEPNVPTEVIFGLRRSSAPVDGEVRAVVTYRSAEQTMTATVTLPPVGPT